MSDVVDIFFSYAREDAIFLQELESHLEPLKIGGLINTWHDGCIMPGEEWDRQVKERLEQAKIIVLLISVDFIKSNYCQEVEFAKALQRHEDRTALVIPIILRHCMWHSIPFGRKCLSHLQVLPKNAKPVTSWSDRDEAFTDIARGIQSAIKQLTFLEDERINSTLDAAPKAKVKIESSKEPSISKESVLSQSLTDGMDEKINAEDELISQCYTPVAASFDASEAQRKLNCEFSVIKSDKRGEKINHGVSKAKYIHEKITDTVKLRMLIIPGGNFLMGAPEEEEGSQNNERPQHLVSIGTFLMSQYLITQEQWQAVVDLPAVNFKLHLQPSHFTGNTHPVEMVSWHEAAEFCARLTKLTGRIYRLPSESEWEYACRARTITPFHFGEAIHPNWANYNSKVYYRAALDRSDLANSYRGRTSPVGETTEANNFGLYDMHGNVLEWCLDTWHDNYDMAPNDGNAWVTNDEHNVYRVIRGGAWSLYPEYCRSANRARERADRKSSRIGFRVVSSSKELG
ncbi:MAG: SUMF1/EgtB/PvdO family nonheme iron enzyme [Cyanobacteria bacterium J06635_10]